MTWSIVQFGDHENLGSPQTCSVTLANPVTSGNLVVVFTGYSSSVNNLTSVTDDKGNAYNRQTFIVGVSASYVWHSAWLNNIVNGPSTITATINTPNSNFSILAIEVAPPPGLPVTLDKFITDAQFNPGLLADAVSTGSVATTAADFLIAGAVSELGTGMVAGTGFTAIQTNAGGNSFTTEYLVQTASGSQAGTWTATVGLQGFDSAMLAFSAIGNPPIVAFTPPIKRMTVR